MRGGRKDGGPLVLALDLAGFGFDDWQVSWCWSGKVVEVGWGAVSAGGRCSLSTVLSGRSVPSIQVSWFDLTLGGRHLSTTARPHVSSLS